MKRLLALIVLAISIIAFGRMIVDITIGDRQKPKCAATDYSCNYDQYMRDISRKPPDFSRADAVALKSREAIKENMRKVLTLPDYESSSMLRVIISYPLAIKKQICESSSAMDSLRSRGQSVSSPHQRDEYLRLLSEMKCI